MNKFEFRCLANSLEINNKLVSLQKDKLYTCEYLTSGSYVIRVYDGIRFLWFQDEADFAKYFEHKKYMRKQKLLKLNEGIV